MQTYKLTHWQRPAWSLLAPYAVQRGLSAEALQLPLAWGGPGLGAEWGAAWTEGWPREGRGGKVGL